jgi:hypothetical protein
MVAGVGRVPRAARRPAELREFVGAVSPRPVKHGQRRRAKTASVAALAAPRFNDVYDAALLRAAGRDRLAALLGIMSLGRGGQLSQVKMVHPGVSPPAILAGSSSGNPARISVSILISATTVGMSSPDDARYKLTGSCWRAAPACKRA